jgi:tape measure domain-containing protein
MSGSRAITLSLSVNGADQLRRDLLAMGDVGESALKKLDAAAMRAAQRGGSLSAVGTVTQDVTRSLEAMGSRLGPIGAGLSSLGVAGAAAAAGLGGIALAATSVARAGDEMTATLGRLASATGSVQSAVDIYDRLYRISLQTGVSVAETAGAFQRFSIATREVGGTNEQALQLVATLQRAALVAGSSGQEASAAAGQLAQALASGVLQGDELRSLLENMPNLAVALARELGVSVGELRKMGSEGQLTADRVLPALLRAGEQINAEFEKLPPTMGRAFETLGAAMTRFAADLDKALGLSQAIARAVNAAASAVDGVRRSAGLGRTPIEDARADEAASQSRLRVLEQQLNLFEPGIRNGTRRGSIQGGLQAAAAGTQEARVAELQAQVARENEILEAAILNRINLEREGASRAEYERAQAAERAATNQRRQADDGLASLRTAYDRERGVRETHARAVAAIGEQLARGTTQGGIDEAEAQRLRAAADRERDEALRRLADSAPRAASGLRQVREAIVYEQADNPNQTVFPMSGIQTITDRNAANERRAAERLATEVQREADANARRLDATVQRFGDSLADVTFNALEAGAVRGESVFQSLASGFGSILRRAAVEALSLTVMQPLVRELAGAVGFTGATSGAGSGAGILSGLTSFLPGGGFGGLAESVGLTQGGSLFGIGTTHSFASNPISIGGALGGVGGGFALGSMLSALTATSPARQTNGMLGSGGGALAGALIGSIIPGIGTLAGGLLGGAGGGLLGGLIGPGKGFEGGDALLRINAQGQVEVSGYSGKGEQDGAREAVLAQARQQAAQLNAQLSASGLRFREVSGEGGLAGALGSGQSDNPRDIAGALAAFSNDAADLVSANDNVMRAISGRTSVSSAVEAAAWVTSVYEVLGSTAEPATQFDTAMKAVNDTFSAAIIRARDLGLATDNLSTAQRKQQQELIDAQNQQIGALQGGITSRYFRAVGMDTEAALLDFDLGAAQQVTALRDALTELGSQAGDTATQVDRLQQVQALERANITRQAAAATGVTASGNSTARGLFESLSFGGLGGLSPAARAAAARASITAAGRAFADGATDAEIAEYARVVQSALPVVRDVEGTSASYAALVNSTSDTLRRAAPGADAAGLSSLIDATTNVEAAIYATDSRGVINDLKTEVGRLNALIAAMMPRLLPAAA